jgi:hypothetical protein
MISFKSIAVQALLLSCILIASLYIFKQNRELYNRIEALERNSANYDVNRLQQVISDVSRIDGALKSLESQYAKLQIRITEINSSAASGRVSSARLAIPSEDHFSPPPLANILPPPPYAIVTKGTAWMSDLSPQQIAEVESIMREHASSLPPLDPNDRPNIEELKEAFEMGQEQVKQKMKEVLNDQQYEKFLESTKPPEVPNLMPLGQPN